jgi:ParB-like chromosome segregation protein Spo0J
MTKAVRTWGQRLAIRYRRIDSLKADARNARIHPKRQVQQLAASLREFGFTNPILLDADGTIIAGHGRVEAAKATGMAEVPTITLAGLSDAQKRALRVADNKIALNASWDFELLASELAALSTLEIDLGVTGFSAGEIEVLLDGGGAAPESDRIPALPAKPRTRPGDIWILGEHRIGCGDSRGGVLAGGDCQPRKGRRRLRDAAQDLG